MKAIDEQGRFDPRCVTFEHPSPTSMLQLHLVYPDGSKNTIDDETDDAEEIAETLRAWLRSHLESALGRKLEDVPKEPEPWRYFLCDDSTVHSQYGGGWQLWRARHGYHKADRFENRAMQPGAFGWHEGAVDNGLPIWIFASREPHCREVSESEAIQFIGRAVLGLPIMEVLR